MSRAMQAEVDSMGPRAASGDAVRVEHLTHLYPPAGGSRRRKREAGVDASGLQRPALDGLSLTIRPGEIFGILGPNGGGKTTLFRILSTMLRPTSGAVSVFGFDALTEPSRVRQQLGVVFQSPSLDPKLTAQENLRHQGHLYGLRGEDLARRIESALEGVTLLDRRHDRVENFSGGMRRRVELAKALLHHPRLLLLDEPATGLDPGARRDVWALLAGYRARGVTVALTTHLMDEADRCDRLAILARGKLVAIDTPANLKSRIGGEVVTIEPDPGQPAPVLAAAIDDRFGPWKPGAAPTVIDGRVRLERGDGAAFVAAVASAFPDKIRAITVGRPTLEDAFMHLTGRPLNEEALTR
jgi:ABC-2 type transport system ATP-binding protein